MDLQPTVFFRGQTSLARRLSRPASGAFTLLEMMVVLIIIGLLAALALPHIRGNLESKAIDAASRQLLEELSFARQKAISQRGTVALVFVSSNILGQTLSPPTYSSEEIATFKKLQGGVYTHYAFFTLRQVGEQPGADFPRYITEWKSLPEKTFIDPVMFSPSGFLREKFAFPLTRPDRNLSTDLPYVAFNEDGRSIKLPPGLRNTGGTPTTDIDIRMARGSILFVREPNGTVSATKYDVQQIPPANSTNNIIHIDAQTGRAKWVKAELK